MAKVSVIFYSTYGHNFKMAEAAAAGAREVPGVTVKVLQVTETLSPEIIEKMGATQTRKEFAHIPVAKVDDLAEADGVIFATPTRFGNMAAQMKAFIDATGSLWANGGLVGKVASVMSSSNSQHGGQESTILTFIPPLLHQGMIYVGLPYTAEAQSINSEISGGSPYGASCVADQGDRETPSKNELGLASFQGKRVAEITKKLFG
jgi:NAD(P)H dehydrogenase (quinone)